MRNTGQSAGKRWNKWQGQQKDIRKHREEVLGIPVCMAAIYVRLSVDSDEKKSESIENTGYADKRVHSEATMKIRTESMKLLYITFILIWEKPEQILTDRDLNG